MPNGYAGAQKHYKENFLPNTHLLHLGQEIQLWTKCLAQGHTQRNNEWDLNPRPSDCKSRTQTTTLQCCQKYKNCHKSIYCWCYFPFFVLCIVLWREQFWVEKTDFFFFFFFFFFFLNQWLESRLVLPITQISYNKDWQLSEYFMEAVNYKFHH